jgi:SpoVK/Ycf46/Vps4 family AAA+-type ATPase
MLSLKDCLRANRPLIFCSCENDLELLNYLNINYKNIFQVYSPTFAKFIKLPVLLQKKFQDMGGETLTLMESLNLIYNRSYQTRNDVFETFIFMDVSLGSQEIRKIKDILSKYQMDDSYTLNLLIVSQTTIVPPELERFSEVVCYGLPSEKELKEFSDDLCSAKKLDLRGDKAPTAEIINNLRGLTFFEVEQAYNQSYKLYDKKIDLNFIRDFKKSSVAKTDFLSLLETDINFDHIGGLSNLKKWIIKSSGGWTVEGKKFGLPLLKGLLMVGVPGCGKSLTAKALGNAWGLPVVNFDPSRVFSSRVGVSEQNMRRVLKIIEGVSPCVMFIDEIEKAFAGSHSSTFSDAGVTSRVIMSFLIWMQECTAPVFTVATSNNIQYLPPEMISRFDQTFFVNVPQYQERIEIFKIHLRKLNKNPEDFDLVKLSDCSKDFSGREIEQALKEAMYDCFYEKKDLSTEAIVNAFNCKPNLITTMAEQLSFLLKWVGWDPQKKDGIRARFAHPVEEDDRMRVMDQIESLIKDVEKGPEKL